MLKSIKVRDYMTRHLLTFRPETDLYEAIGRLLEHRVSGAPVVDGHGRLVGILSTDDCLRHVVSDAYYESSGGSVGGLMTAEVETISPEADILDACERMFHGNRRRLPVLDGQQLVGQISRHDVLKAVRAFAQHDRAKSTAG